MKPKVGKSGMIRNQGTKAGITVEAKIHYHFFLNWILEAKSRKSCNALTCNNLHHMSENMQ